MTWRNHTRTRSTRYEVFVFEMSDNVGLSPDGRFDARQTHLQLTMREDVAMVLLDAVNIPAIERYQGTPKSTYGTQLTSAQKWARDVDRGHWREPRMPDLSTPKKRKKKR